MVKLIRILKLLENSVDYSVIRKKLRSTSCKVVAEIADNKNQDELADILASFGNA